jgi:hypothetical protein
MLTSTVGRKRVKSCHNGVLNNVNDDDSDADDITIIILKRSEKLGNFLTSCVTISFCSMETYRFLTIQINTENIKILTRYRVT